MASETLKNQPFLQMSSDMFGYIHPDGKLFPLNPAWEHILGFTCTELQSRQWMELVHPDDRQSTSAQFAKLSAEDCNIISLRIVFCAVTASIRDSSGQYNLIQNNPVIVLLLRI